MLCFPVSVPALPKLSHMTTKLPVLSIATGGNSWPFVVYSAPPDTGCAQATGSHAGWLLVRSTSIRERMELPAPWVLFPFRVGSTGGPPSGVRTGHAWGGFGVPYLDSSRC